MQGLVQLCGKNLVNNIYPVIRLQAKIGELSIEWTRRVELTGANTATPTFTAPTAATSLVFSLTVTDSLGQVSSPDSVTITVVP